MKKSQKGWLALNAISFALVADVATAGQVLNAEAVASGQEYRGFIVKFRDGSSEQFDQAAAQASFNGSVHRLAKAGAVDMSARANPGRPLRLDHVRRMSMGASVVHPSRRLGAAEARAVMQDLAALPDVEFVEPDMVVSTALTPVDPLYSQQWALQEGVAAIRPRQAWDTTTGVGVTVAVLDTGIAAHSDLSANVVAGYDFVSAYGMSSNPGDARDGNGRDADASDPGNWCPGTGAPSNWHGTHVAGTIGAVTSNSVGVAGVAYQAKIMPVRVLGVCGSGVFSDIADAITWASGGTVPNVPTLASSAVAKVINMSIGGLSPCGSSLQNAINGARSRGTTVVAAAGNNNRDATQSAPANCSGVIAVAATDSAGAKASFSNYGPKVVVSAPGVNVLSTSNYGTQGPGSERYVNMSGTSMASPHVAGVVALAQARSLGRGQPLLSPAEVEALLKATASPLPSSCSQGCGAGIVNAAAMVAAAVPQKVSERVDSSGKISIAIFERVAALSQEKFLNFPIHVPSDYVVIGGGVEAAEGPYGNLLTASYPNGNLTAWMVSSKSLPSANGGGSFSNPIQIKGWAVGLKINGLTRQQLLSHISVHTAQSASSSAPSAVVGVASGYSLIGGGFNVNYGSGVGSFGTASYPDGATWRVASKAHGIASPATVTAYSVALRSSISGVGTIQTNVASVESAYANHPKSFAPLSTSFALTSCGALVNWSGYGNLLWELKPVNAKAIAPAVPPYGCEAGSKDHEVSSPATIRSFAMGIRVQ